MSEIEKILYIDNKDDEGISLIFNGDGSKFTIAILFQDNYLGKLKNEDIKMHDLRSLVSSAVVNIVDVISNQLSKEDGKILFECCIDGLNQVLEYKEGFKRVPVLPNLS